MIKRPPTEKSKIYKLLPKSLTKKLVVDWEDPEVLEVTRPASSLALTATAEPVAIDEVADAGLAVAPLVLDVSSLQNT